MYHTYKLHSYEHRIFLYQLIEKAEAREKERLKAEERKVNACMYFTAVISNIGMYGEVIQQALS